MKLPSYKELVNMEYKLIFDYYDQPLSFVAKIGSIDYLFYYISNEEYFLTQIDIDVAKKLNDLKNLTKLYEYLKQKQKIQIVTFDFKNKKVKFIPLSSFKNAQEYLPKSGENITFDYQNEIKINSNTNLLKYIDISSSLSSLAVRLINSNNSHSLSANVIKNTIDYVINIYNAGIASCRKLFNNSDDVFISSFSPGSFIINFEFSDSDINDKTFDSLYRVASKINDVNSPADPKLFLEETNKQIFTDTKDLYEKVLKKSNVNIEFYKNTQKDNKNHKIKISPNKFVSENIKNYSNELKKIDEKVKEENIEVKTKKISIKNAHFISGNIRNNTLKFESIDEGQKDAKFEPSLFKKIKNSTDKELRLSYEVPVNLDVTVETTYNKETNESKEKNIITNYNYV